MLTPLVRHPGSWLGLQSSPCSHAAAPPSDVDDARLNRGPAISVSGLVKTFGSTTGARRPRSRRERTARCTASSARTGRARRRRSASCSACSAPTRGTPCLLGGDPWRDAVALHRRLAYVPGDVTLWPKLSGGEVIDLLGRLRGRPRSGAPRRAARPLRARPDEEGADLLEGQPAEGRARRRARISAELLILDEPTSGLDPLMEAVFQDCIQRGEGRRSHRALSSHILAEVRGALRPGHDHPRRPDPPERHVAGAARSMTRTSIVAEVGAVARWTRRHLPGDARPHRRRPPRPLRRRHRPPRRRSCGAWASSACAPSSVNRPRSRSCSSVTTATSWHHERGGAPRFDDGAP